MTHGSLSGVGVLVTRPARQAEGLCRRIRAEGGLPETLPTIAIEPAGDACERFMADIGIGRFGAAIFVSANAVANAVPVLLAGGPLSPDLAVIAVGPGTARALRELGLSQVIVPDDGADSEAVLRLPVLSSSQRRRVVIFSGEGGRTFLQDTLRDRGMEVDVVSCYRRTLPPTIPAAARSRILEGTIHAVTCTSSEGLRNLYGGMLTSDLAERLRRVLHVVSHPRIAQTARECGAMDIVLADAGDDAIVETLLARLGSLPARSDLSRAQ
jgi:uroporphyrinogen-III synthase